MHIHYRITNILIGLALLLAALAPQTAYGQSPDPAAHHAGSTTAAALAPGLSLLMDINPGRNGRAMSAVAYGSKIFFLADDGVHGLEPWITDGTTGGTHMIKDINPNGDGASYEPWAGDAVRPVVWNGKVYFVGTGVGPNKAAPPQLWVSDGTAAGTHAVTSDDHPIHSLKAGAQGITFQDQIMSSGADVWFSDGTAQNTFLVYSWKGQDLYYPFEQCGVVYVASPGAAYSYPMNGELWKVSITTRQATLLEPSGIRTIYGCVNGLLYYGKNTPPQAVTITWQTDGTPQGTQIAGSANPSLKDIFIQDSIVDAGDAVYFVGSAAGTGLYSLYRMNKVDQSVTNVFNSDRYLRNLAFKQGLLYYGLDHVGWVTPWRSGGIPTATWELCETCLHDSNLFYDRWGTFHNHPMDFTPINGTLLYAAMDGAGSELWISGGTDDTTHRLVDLYPGKNSSGPTNLISMDGYVFFIADDGEHGLEPWIYRPIAPRMVTHRDTAAVAAETTRSIDVLNNDQHLDGKQFWLSTIDANSIRGGRLARDDSGTPGYPLDDRILYTPPYPNDGFVFEGPDEFSYTIADGSGLEVTGRVSIQVVHANFAPTSISINNNQIAENAPAGTLVGNLTVADPNRGDTHTCAINTPGSPFMIQGMEVHTTGPVDYETKPSYEVSILCTDTGGLSVEQSLLFNVSNVNEPPVITSPLIFTVTEDGSQDYALTWTDPENSQAIWPVMKESPKHGTILLPDSHTIRYQPEADFVGTDTLTFDLTDYGFTSGPLYVPTTLTITVLPGNDDPPIMTPLNLVLVPNQTGSRTVALTGIAAGPYEVGPVSISAEANNPAAVTDITVNYTEGPTGALTFTFHTEVADSATITVTLDDGVNQSQYTFPVQTTDVPPLFLPLVGR